MPSQLEAHKIYVIVLVVAILAIGFNFVRAQSTISELEDAGSKLSEVNKELKTFKETESKLEQLVLMADGLEKVFNGNAGGLKFSTGYTFIAPNGDKNKITLKKSSNFPIKIDQLSRSLSNEKHGTKICKDLSLHTDGFNKDNEAEIRITSGSSTGYEIIRFTNGRTNETTYILIMVADTKK